MKPKITDKISISCSSLSEGSSGNNGRKEKIVVFYWCGLSPNVDFVGFVVFGMLVHRRFYVLVEHD